MGVLDFLFQGQQPAQQTNYTQGQSNVPTWLQEYTQGILAQANSLGAQPYQPYGGPRISPFTDAQTQAQQAVQNLQGGYQGALGQAQQLAGSSAQPQAIQGALGLLPQAQSTISGAFNPQLYGQAYGYLPQAQGQIGAASNPANFSGALSYLPQAQGMVQNALTPGAAQINPYTGNVIQKAEDTATQYWNNQLLPSIDQQYAASGQAGSSANTRALGQAGAQVTQNIQDTANAALSQAYQNAQQTGLQGAQQTAGLGQLSAGIAGQQGQLGLQGAQQLAGLGSLQGQLASGQAGLGLQTGQALGALGQIGGGLGYEQGVLGLQGANTLGSLGQLGQNLGLQGATALDTVGGQQQQQQQQNLNLAYQDFLNQQQYPYQQASWLSQMLQGTATPTTVPGLTQGAYTGTPAATGPSPLYQSVGLYNLLNPGTANVNQGIPGGARGGRFRRSGLDHVSTRRRAARSGLSSTRRAA